MGLPQPTIGNARPATSSGRPKEQPMPSIALNAPISGISAVVSAVSSVVDISKVTPTHTTNGSAHNTFSSGGIGNGNGNGSAAASSSSTTIAFPSTPPQHGPLSSSTAVIAITSPTGHIGHTGSITSMTISTSPPAPSSAPPSVPATPVPVARPTSSHGGSGATGGGGGGGGSGGGGGGTPHHHSRRDNNSITMLPLPLAALTNTNINGNSNGNGNGSNNSTSSNSSKDNSNNGNGSTSPHPQPPTSATAATAAAASVIGNQLPSQSSASGSPQPTPSVPTRTLVMRQRASDVDIAARSSNGNNKDNTLTVGAATLAATLSMSGNKDRGLTSVHLSIAADPHLLEPTPPVSPVPAGASPQMTTAGNMIREATAIYDEYVRADASFEINLDSSTRVETERLLRQCQVQWSRLIQGLHTTTNNFTTVPPPPPKFGSLLYHQGGTGNTTPLGVSSTALLVTSTPEEELCTRIRHIFDKPFGGNSSFVYVSIYVAMIYMNMFTVCMSCVSIEVLKLLQTNSFPRFHCSQHFQRFVRDYKGWLPGQTLQRPGTSMGNRSGGNTPQPTSRVVPMPATPSTMALHSGMILGAQRMGTLHFGSGGFNTTLPGHGSHAHAASIAISNAVTAVTFHPPPLASNGGAAHHGPGPSNSGGPSAANSVPHSRAPSELVLDIKGK
jgi:hypothetical protein